MSLVTRPVTMYAYHGLVMIWMAFVSFVVSALAAGFVVRYMRRHARIYGEAMPQRFHLGDVPRLGGLAVLLGMVGGWGLGVVQTGFGDLASLRLGAWVGLWLLVMLPRRRAESCGP